MTNPHIARMLDQEAYDRAVAAQKVHNRNAVLEDENTALRARVAELTGRVGELEGALGFYADDGNCNEDGAFIDHESERVTSASNPDLLDLGDRARAALRDSDDG